MKAQRAAAEAREHALSTLIRVTPGTGIYFSVPHLKAALGLDGDEVGELIKQGLYWARDPIRGGRGVWLIGAEAAMQGLAVADAKAERIATAALDAATQRKEVPRQ
jgi:hypothetical protein